MDLGVTPELLPVVPPHCNLMFTYSDAYTRTYIIRKRETESASTLCICERAESREKVNGRSNLYLRASSRAQSIIFLFVGVRSTTEPRLEEVTMETRVCLSLDRTIAFRSRQL